MGPKKAKKTKKQLEEEKSKLFSFLLKSFRKNGRGKENTRRIREKERGGRG